MPSSAPRPDSGSAAPSVGPTTTTLAPPRAGFPAGDDRTNALAINRATESLIRRNPEQYLWIHKRYKRRPDGSFGIYED